MNRVELDIELKQMGVSPREYNLQGDLIPDSIVLYNSYKDWQVFYFDERGNKNDENVFNTECEACWYIFRLFRESKEIENKFG